MRARMIFVAAAMFASGTILCLGQDASSELTALVHDVMQPYAAGTPVGAPEPVKKAAEILKNARLLGAARPTLPSNQLIEQYGRILALGTRTANFAADIAAIHDALLGGDAKAIRQAIRVLSQHAGRTEPDNATMTKMVDQLLELKGAQAPMEHATLDQPDRSIDISWSKRDGKVKVDVIDQKGPDGKPVRTVFDGNATTRPDASGKSLATAGKPSTGKPRQVTEDSAKALREKIGGKWRDQEGLIWLISGGKSTGIILTQYYASGHKVEYMSDYKLATIKGTYTVKDPKDIRQGLPDEIKQQLASKYHPPYKIRLDVNDAADRIEGRWVSEHVTYDPMDLSISKVGDPFDTPLILTRAVMSGTALGMKEGDFP